MAGGMTPGGCEALAQRVENTRARQAGHGTQEAHGKRPASWADSFTEPPPTVAPPAIKHCWYDGPHGRQAALLLGWHQIEGRYCGRIAVTTLEPEGWIVTEMWVDPGMLSPAGS